MTTTTSELHSSTTPPRSAVADLGLLALRIGIGATMIQAGLMKFLDFDTTVGFMESGGWRLPTVAAFMVSTAETVGGIALVLGLLTPLAACAVIAAMIDAWLVNVSGGTVWSDPFNLPFVLAIGSIALLFAGPGKFSLDAVFFSRPVWPAPVTIGLKIVAVLAAVATWVLLNGTNPIHFSAPAG